MIEKEAVSIKNKEIELQTNKKAVEGAILAVTKEENLLETDLKKLDGDKKAAIFKKNRFDQKASLNKQKLMKKKESEEEAKKLLIQKEEKQKLKNSCP